MRQPRTEFPPLSKIILVQAWRDLGGGDHFAAWDITASKLPVRDGVLEHHHHHMIKCYIKIRQEGHEDVATDEIGRHWAFSLFQTIGEVRSYD